MARCRPPPPRCVRKWLSREEGGSARLTLPAALGGGASGSGAVCTMPTSFTVVPVEAQGEERERDGQQREEEDEGDERDRGTGERVGKRRGSTPEERRLFVCGGAGLPHVAGRPAAGEPLNPMEGPHRLSAAGDAGATCPAGEVRFGRVRNSGAWGG